MVSCESDCGGLDQRGKLVVQPPTYDRFTTTLLYDEAITKLVCGISIHFPNKFHGIIEFFITEFQIYSCIVVGGPLTRAPNLRANFRPLIFRGDTRTESD